MRIRDMMDSASVEIGAELCTKDEALRRLVALHESRGNVRNTGLLLAEINERERLNNSAVAGRIAIPCVSHCGAQNTSITALTVRDGVDYGAPDKRPVNLIFMIAGRENSAEYLFLKTRLMRLLTDAAFTARLSCAKTADEFLALLSEREDRRFPIPAPQPAYDCSRYLPKQNTKKRPLARVIEKFKRK